MKHDVWRAALSDQGDIVKWLHFNTNLNFTKHVMDYFMGSGNLKMVKWLTKNRKEGFSIKGLEIGAMYGNLKTMKWVCKNNPNLDLTSSLMYSIRESCSDEVVKWLYFNTKFDKDKIDKIINAYHNNWLLDLLKLK